MPVTTLDSLKSFTSFVFVRLAVGTLVTTSMMLGGVYFIVNSALGGIQTAIATTNERITDMGKSITQQIAHSESNLRNEFQSTRELLKRASTDGPYGVSSWRVAGIEFFYPKQGIGIALQDFLQKTNFSFASAELEQEKGKLFPSIRFFAVPPNDQYLSFKSRGYKFDDAILTSESTLERAQAVAMKFSACVSLNGIGSKKYFLEATKQAIVLDDAIVCPMFGNVR